MGGLTIVVGAASVGIATFGYACRRALPTPALVLLGQASITGMLISLAASDPVCNYTTWLIGKVRPLLLRVIPAKLCTLARPSATLVPRALTRRTPAGP